jgi:predicted nucleic acid-binding protein
LTELRVIRHEPDTRFLECAIAASADLIVTVNTAVGHFDQKRDESVGVVTSGEFLKVLDITPLLKKLGEH